jgi:hypothetical protein
VSKALVVLRATGRDESEERLSFAAPELLILPMTSPLSSLTVVIVNDLCLETFPKKADGRPIAAPKCEFSLDEERQADSPTEVSGEHGSVV